MSEGELYRNPIQELEQLKRDLNEIKGLMKDVALRMSQIERHVKRAFVPIGARESGGNDTPRKRSRRTPEEPPSINPEQALNIFDELKSLLRTAGTESVLDRLDQIPLPDLKLMAREVGLTFKSKPSKKALSHRILGRMNESVLLSKNTNVTLPRSMETQEEPHKVNGLTGLGDVAADKSTTFSENGIGERDSGGSNRS